MSSEIWPIVIGVVLFAHGIGHSLGLFPVFGWAMADHWSDRSWLLTKIVGQSATRRIGVVIWIAALLGFTASALGIFGLLVPSQGWPVLAVVSSIVSLIGLTLFWNAFPGTLNKVGAIGVDVAALVTLLGAKLVIS
jgi:hypothetical protein